MVEEQDDYIASRHPEYYQKDVDDFEAKMHQVLDKERG